MRTRWTAQYSHLQSKPVMRTVRQAHELRTTRFYLNQQKARTSCHAAILALFQADLFVHFPFFSYNLYIFFDTISGEYFFHLRESVRFASVRSRVRSPSCPPKIRCPLLRCTGFFIVRGRDRIIII